MSSPRLSHTINIHVNTSPTAPPRVEAEIAPANVSPKRKKGKVALSSQTDEEVWGLTDDKILGALFSGRLN